MPSNDVFRYAKSRLLTPAFLIVCGLCAGLTLALMDPKPVRQALQVLGPYLLALAGFRLWDDLSDLPLDRRKHPLRVLCRTRQLPLFRLLAAAGIAFPLLLIRQAPHASLAYLLYCASLALTYDLTQSTTDAGAGASLQRKARVAVVLLKYPVVCLSALLALRPTVYDAAVIQALLLLYACVVTYEMVSDSKRSAT